VQRSALLLIVACSTPSVRRPDVIGAAELVDVSSEYNEIRLAESPDGNLRLWGSTDRPGGPGGWNVWMSRRTGDAWSPPVPTSFDSDSNDFDPAFSRDGAWVYFFSNRPGGQGGDDIYRAAVTADGFGAAENLGPNINTPGDEWAPTPANDGLLFASNVPKQKHDLYFARWGQKAARLPGAINTPIDEFDATFVDDRTIVFSRSTDVENDPIELYMSHRGASGWDAGTKLPASVNVAGGYTLGPALDLHDPSILYFSGKRPEAGRGKLDIYRVHLQASR
jgi:hypothetical protein